MKIVIYCHPFWCAHVYLCNKFSSIGCSEHERQPRQKFPTPSEIRVSGRRTSQTGCQYARKILYGERSLPRERRHSLQPRSSSWLSQPLRLGRLDSGQRPRFLAPLFSHRRRCRRRLSDAFRLFRPPAPLSNSPEVGRCEAGNRACTGARHSQEGLVT